MTTVIISNNSQSNIRWHHRATSSIIACFMLLQCLAPSIVLAANIISDVEISQFVNRSVSSQQFIESTINQKFQYVVNPITDSNVSTINSIKDFHSSFATAKLVGDKFVQSRYIRWQIQKILGRHQVNPIVDGQEVSEAEQINALYAEGKNLYSPELPYGSRLPKEKGITTDLIWPEKRLINGEEVLVPIVYLSEETIANREVDSLRTGFDAGTVIVNSIVNEGDLTARQTKFIQVINNFQNSGNVSADSDLNLYVGGTLSNISGSILAGDNATIVANLIHMAPVVHWYKDEWGQGTRLGDVAVAEAVGDLTIQSYSDIHIQGSEVNAENITIAANGNVTLESQQIGYDSNTQEGQWTTTSSQLNHVQTTLSAENNISLLANGTITINAAELIAQQGTLELLAGQGIFILDDQNQKTVNKTDDIGRTTGVINEFTTIAVRAALEAGKGILIETEVGDITLRATEIVSSNGTQINANNGKVNLLLTKEQDHYYRFKKKEGFWKIKTETQTDKEETAVYNSIVGGVKVQATHGLTIEFGQKEGITLSDMLTDFSESDDLQWMSEIYNDQKFAGNIETVYLELLELHEFEKTSNLSPGAMAIIAIAVAVASGGAGLIGVAGSAGSITSFSIGTTTLLSANVVQAGFLAIATQAATGLASGQGLENTAKSLFHSDNIKATATAMVTAGVMQELDGKFEFFEGTADVPLTDAQSLTNQATQAVGNATVRTSISTVISGGDLGDFEDAFKISLLQSGVDALGEHVAGEIGGFTDLGPALRYIAHAGLGCLTGSLTSEVSGSDTALGCYSGAGGAVIAEVTADLYLETIEDETNAVLTELAANGDAYTQQELRDLALILEQKGVDIAKLSAAFAALVLGGNVDIAATAGQNAAENNSLSTLIIHLLYEWNQPGYHKAQLAILGRGEHPSQVMIDEAIAAGVDLLVEIVDENVDEQTLKDIASQIDTVEKYSQEYVGQYVGELITFVYLSDTGQATIAEWNKVDKETRDALIGAGKILSIAIPIAKVKYIGDVNDAIKVDHQKSVNDHYDTRSTFNDPENLTIISGFDSVTDQALNPELLRSEMDGYVKDTKVRDGYSLSVASITADGETEYLIAVSGGKTIDPLFRDSLELSLNGKSYTLVEKDTGTVREVWNPENQQGNNNHAEKKLMSYMQDKYSGQSATVTITSQNTFADKPGMCIGCQFSNDNFGSENPGFTINMYHGVKND